MGGCGGLERTDFKQFLLWEGVVVLKELILNSFYFGRVWWSWKNWFWTVSTLGGLVILKELILNSFYFGRVVLKGGLERTDFEQFLLWEDMMILKGCGGLENWFWTVSTLGGCGGLERTDFEQFLLWEGVVVLKEFILNRFYFGRVWWSWKNWFWTVSTLGGCEGLVVFLKELILNNFLFGRVWWSWKNSFWTDSSLGGCGGLERTDFEQFLLWEGLVVLKENWFWTVSTLGGYDNLERTDFEQFLV